jgi:hypothetical protein
VGKSEAFPPLSSNAGSSRPLKSAAAEPESFGGRELLVKTTAKTASRRRRPKTVPKGNTAKFFSYAAAFGWIKRSIAHRFFLEAVTLERALSLTG